MQEGFVGLPVPAGVDGTLDRKTAPCRVRYVAADLEANANRGEEEGAISNPLPVAEPGAERPR